MRAGVSQFHSAPPEDFTSREACSPSQRKMRPDGCKMAWDHLRNGLSTANARVAMEPSAPLLIFALRNGNGITETSVRPSVRTASWRKAHFLLFGSIKATEISGKANFMANP